MHYLLLSIGSAIILIGLAIISLTFIFLRENRVKNIFTGVVFAFQGAAIIWLVIQGNDTNLINIGISGEQTSLLLIGFVMSLFILKGAFDIREGKRNLQDKTISSSLAFRSKFQIIVATIITTFTVLILLLAFMQFGG